MWESCTLVFPCAVNRVIHDGIACYTHFHDAVFVLLFRNSVVLAVYLLFLVSASLSYMSIGAGVVVAVALHQIDDPPNAQASAQGDHKGLKNVNCGIEKSHL